MSTEEWPQRNLSLCHPYSFIAEGALYLVSLVFVISLACAPKTHFQACLAADGITAGLYWDHNSRHHHDGGVERL